MENHVNTLKIIQKMLFDFFVDIFLYKKTCNCMIFYSFLSKKFPILPTCLF